MNPSATNILNMTGGTIKENVAAACGGGIFIQCSMGNSGASKAIIKEGEIINNKKSMGGRSFSEYGGGGIYVNGIEGSDNGELYLYNAIINKNTSVEPDEGYAACPCSKTYFYLNDGVALYGHQKDVFIKCLSSYLEHGGKPTYRLSRRMLGGVKNEWKDNGKLLDDNQYEKDLNLSVNGAALNLHTDSKGNELTKALAKVYITGNTSKTKGAGIGSNGTVYFGTEGTPKSIKVQKAWKGEDNKDNKRPKSIKVTLMAKKGEESTEYEVETVELNEENKWRYEFKDLPSMSGDTEINYTVKEEAVTGYSSKITGSEADGYTITNTPEEPDKKTRDITVKKVWNIDPKTITLASIEFRLFKNGKESDITVKLGNYNNWQATIKDLDVNDENGKEIVYTIGEVGESHGSITIDGMVFEVSVTGDMDKGFTINNIYNPPEEPEKEYRDISVEKAWDVRGEKPISHIEVELYRDGEATGNTLVLSEANGWSGSFKNLVKASDGGHIYDYSVKEIGEKFYTVEISGEYYEVIYRGNMDSGFTIINKEEPPRKPQRRDIRVRKVWDVTNKIPVDAIQVELYKDGRATGNVITLSEANGWSGRFEDLIAYDVAGVKYEYSVREVGEASHRVSISGSDYDVSYEGDMNHSFVITNKENTPPKKKIEVRVNKTWQTSGETEAVQVELYMDGAATGKIINLSEANGWNGVFTDLDLEDANGNKHIYTVKEIGEVSGKYYIGERKFNVIYEGNMNSGITIINSEEPPKEEEEKKPPIKKDTPSEKHIIPKTGVEEGTLSIVLALVVLVGLFFVKRKLNEGKSK